MLKKKKNYRSFKRVLHLSLLVLEGDMTLGGLSSLGKSSIAMSKDTREAWEFDPASEAIRSASLRACWASCRMHSRQEF